LHRVLDVEQLHVEEDLLAGPCQLAGEIEAARHDELEADLVDGDGGPQPRSERARPLDRGQIEGHDQPVTCAQIRDNSCSANTTRLSAGCCWRDHRYGGANVPCAL